MGVCDPSDQGINMVRGKGRAGKERGGRAGMERGQTTLLVLTHANHVEQNNNYFLKQEKYFNTASISGKKKG